MEFNYATSVDDIFDTPAKREDWTEDDVEEGRPLLRRQRGRAEGQHRLDASRGARGVHLRTSGGGTSPPQLLV